jgi:hypothetical protein
MSRWVARPLGEVDEDAVLDLADRIEQEEGVAIEVAYRWAMMRLSAVTERTELA